MIIMALASPENAPTKPCLTMLPLEDDSSRAQFGVIVTRDLDIKLLFKTEVVKKEKDEIIREHRQIDIKYDFFVEKLIKILISGLSYIRSGQTETKVLLNEKKPGGLTVCCLSSPSSTMAIDIR